MPQLEMVPPVFPAPAGMNRTPRSIGYQLGCVPRTRGDEPQCKTLLLPMQPCSPHPRG